MHGKSRDPRSGSACGVAQRIRTRSIMLRRIGYLRTAAQFQLKPPTCEASECGSAPLEGWDSPAILTFDGFLVFVRAWQIQGLG